MSFFWQDPSFIKSLNSLKLVIKNQARGIRFGENRSKQFGSGVEVSHLKNYSIGEDVKNIDWNASFRLNRTFVKVFSETRENNVYIMIDRSLSMAFGEPETKRNFALKLAYCIAYLSLSGYNKVYLIEFGDSVYSAEQISRVNINRKFIKLCEEPSSGGTTFAKSLSGFFANFKKRGLLFLISDFIDEGLSIIDYVSRIALSHNFCVLHVLSDDDVEIAETGEYKYEDSETGETVELSLTPEAAREYGQRINEFCGLLMSKAQRYGGVYKKAMCGARHVEILKDALRMTAVNRGE